MASKTGSFLKASDRQKILLDLQQKGELALGNVPESVRKEVAEVMIHNNNGNHHHNNCGNAMILAGEQFGTGCLACGEDDDHANLLLCEACNAEYHTYCLEPPLRAVPTGDWFCSECKAATRHFDEDGLDALVDALSPCFTSRFGEVCWAQGGVGFGWWPAFIYDPRLTVGTARQSARKNLEKKHLVYFFECHDAPFSVLTSVKITKWENGLIDDFHLGKAARGAGQKRTKNFKQALQAATIEYAKPIEMRMDWNHSDQPQILPCPQPKKVPPQRKRPRRELSPLERPALEQTTSKSSRSKTRTRSQPRGFPLLASQTQASEMVQFPTRRNLNLALDGLAMSTKSSGSTVNSIVELAEDGELFVKLLQKQSLSMEGPAGEAVPNFESSDSNSNSSSPCKNVGFVKLLSRKSNTFADARLAIQQELVPDTLSSDMEWRFFVPGLGPVSNKQEASLGPIYKFLRRTTLDTNVGDGTLLHPLKVFIMELKDATTTSDTTS